MADTGDGACMAKPNNADDSGVGANTGPGAGTMEDSEPCTQPMPDDDLEDNDSHEESIEIDQSQASP